MKTKWTRQIPSNGWYWVQYKNKYGTLTIVPAEVMRYDAEGGELVAVSSAKNDTFIEWTKKKSISADKSFRFGPRIKFPK